jgi:hypothetical protein
MRRVLFSAAIGLMICFVGLSACTKGTDKESDVVKIDPVSEETAKDIRKTLRAPIDRARHAQDLGEERTNAIDEATKRQQ